MNLCAAVANIACNGIGLEPILGEANTANNTPALYADYTVNDIWPADRAAVIDNRIIKADAPSY